MQESVFGNYSAIIVGVQVWFNRQTDHDFKGFFHRILDNIVFLFFAELLACDILKQSTLKITKDGRAIHK